MSERGGLPPARVEVTAAFLAEATERQRAYQARRKLWTAAFQPSEPRAQAASRSRRMVEAELQGGGTPSPRDVAEARRGIVNTVLKMIAKGDIHVESALGEGTTFFLELPFTTQA